jgi:dolichyl-phosphate-mannose--protein O-mannosyl transferase
VWWGATLLLVVVAVVSVLARVTALRVLALPGRAPPRLWVALAGYVAFYLPLARVPRILFMYHYFTPLIFSVVLVVLWLDHARWTSPAGLARQRASYYGVIATIAILFVALAPLTYGLDAGARLADAVFRVFPAWR